MRLPILLLLVSVPAMAQFWAEMANPKVEVVLTHPPSLGLKIGRIAFLPGHDLASRELADRLTAGLLDNRAIEVVDRSHLDAVLREQELGANGYFNPATITTLGRLLGPSALVVVNVNRSDYSKNQTKKEEKVKDSKGVEQVRVEHRSTLTLDFTASVQVVDLVTGRVFGAQRMEENPSRTAKSYDGWPAFPREAELRQEAYDRAQERIFHMLLPWEEKRQLTFFDDQEFLMDQAHQKIGARDYRGALVLARRGLELSKQDRSRKSKYYPRPWYNVGIIHFILGEYDVARPFLQQALDMQPDAGIFKTALQECADAQELQAEMRKVDERSRGQQRTEARPAAAGTPDKPVPSLEERLERLSDLRKKGLITEQEYLQKKAEILKDL